MSILFISLTFIGGLCLGSFLNVLIYRLPLSLSILGRSFCPKCKKKISWYDNIPILSFLLLKGRCRKCQSPISWQYPIVELTTGVLTVYCLQSTVSNGYPLILNIYNLLLIYAFILIFFIDLQHEIIPDQIIYSGILINLFFLVSLYPSILVSNLITGLISAGFFFLLYIITRGRGMGFGDVKLVLLLGLFLGWPKIVIALYLAFLTGAIVGVILIIIGRKKLKSHIPFGPFLAGSTIFSLFWGEIIYKYFLSILF